MLINCSRAWLKSHDIVGACNLLTTQAGYKMLCGHNTSCSCTSMRRAIPGIVLVICFGPVHRLMNTLYVVYLQIHTSNTSVRSVAVCWVERQHHAPSAMYYTVTNFCACHDGKTSDCNHKQVCIFTHIYTTMINAHMLVKYIFSLEACCVYAEVYTAQV